MFLERSDLKVLNTVELVSVDELCADHRPEDCLKFIHRSRGGRPDGVLDGEGVTVLPAGVVSVDDQHRVERLSEFAQGAGVGS
jgi:hypothetical protein